MLGAKLRRRASFATFSFVTSANADADTISYPGSTAIGDLLIFFDGAAGQTATYAHPTDFTGIGVSDFLRGDSTRVVVAASWRIATATTGTVKGDFTQATGSGARRKILAVFRPDMKISAVESFDHDSVMAAASPASQTINAAAGIAPLIAIGHCRRFGNSVAGWPANLTAMAGGTLAHRAGYQIQNYTPADLSVESPGYSSGYSGLQTFYLRGAI